MLGQGLIRQCCTSRRNCPAEVTGRVQPHIRRDGSCSASVTSLQHGLSIDAQHHQGWAGKSRCEATHCVSRRTSDLVALLAAQMLRGSNRQSQLLYSSPRPHPGSTYSCPTCLPSGSQMNILSYCSACPRNTAATCSEEPRPCATREDAIQSDSGSHGRAPAVSPGQLSCHAQTGDRRHRRARMATASRGRLSRAAPRDRSRSLEERNAGLSRRSGSSGTCFLMLSPR